MPLLGITVTKKCFIFGRLKLGWEGIGLDFGTFLAVKHNGLTVILYGVVREDRNQKLVLGNEAQW
jgi:hypothetical protein